MTLVGTGKQSKKLEADSCIGRQRTPLPSLYTCAERHRERDTCQRARIGYERFYSREHYMARYLGLIEAMREGKRAVNGRVEVVGT